MIDSGELLRFVAAFGAIGLVLYGFAAFSRRHIGAGPFPRGARVIEVIETVPLPHGSSLHVVRLGDAYFAIGRTDGEISLLTAIPTEAVAARHRTERLMPADRRAPWFIGPQAR